MAWIVRASKGGSSRDLFIDAPTELAARGMVESAGYVVESVQLEPPRAQGIAPIPEIYAPPVYPPPALEGAKKYSFWRDPFVLLAALVATVGPAFLAPTQHAPEKEDLLFGYYTGRALGSFAIFYGLVGLVAWVIFIAAGRLKVVARLVFIPLTLLLSAVVTFGMYLNQKALNQRVTDAKQREFVEKMNSIVHHPSKPAPTVDHSKPLEQQGGQSKDMALFYDASTKLMTEIQQDRQDYERKLQGIVQDGLLRPEHFESPETIADLKAKVTQLRTLVDEHEKHSMELINGFPDRVQALDMPAELKESCIRGYKIGAAKSTGTLHRIAEIDRSFCKDVDSLADFFLNRQGLYQLQGKKLIFQKHADLVSYNAKVNHIGRLTKMEQELMEQAQKYSEQEFQKVKEATGVDPAGDSGR